MHVKLFDARSLLISVAKLTASVARPMMTRYVFKLAEIIEEEMAIWRISDRNDSIDIDLTKASIDSVLVYFHLDSMVCKAARSVFRGWIRRPAINHSHTLIRLKRFLPMSLSKSLNVV